MSNTIRIAVAAAAVVLVLVIGYSLLGRSNVGAPGASTSPTPSATPTETPVPSVPLGVPPAGALAIGRHSMTLAGVALSMDFTTADWISNGSFGMEKGNATGSLVTAFILWPDSAADNVYSDPCAGTRLSPPAGRSISELAAAVSQVPGVALVSGPSQVTVGGKPAQQVVITIPADIDCAPNAFYLWYDADDPTGPSGRYATSLGSTIYTWIIDVDGTTVWIDGETEPDAGPGAAEELQQIVNSIQFE